MRIAKSTYGARIASAVLLGAVLLPASAFAQGGRGAGPPATAKAVAPIDLTGYWVSLVTEDWRYRMMTPALGDFPNVPVNQGALRLTRGIRLKMKRTAISARATARLTSSACRDACTSHGRTTTR